MLLSVDTETFLVQPGVLAPKLVCLTWSDGNRTGLLDRKDGIRFARKALSDHTVQLVGHRIAYDLAVLAAEDSELLPLIFDAYEQGRIYSTDVRQKLLDAATGNFDYYAQNGKKVKNKFSLAQLASRYLGKTIQKGKNSWQLRFQELDDVPIENYPISAVSYAVGDAVDTLLIKQAQDKFCGYDEIPTEALQTRAAWALHLLSVWGVRTEEKRVLETKNALVEKRESLEKQVKASGIMRIDGTKDLKLIRAKVEKAYADQGLLAPLTELGNISTDKECLTESRDPELVAVSEYTHVDKLLETYLPVLLAASKAPFCASFNVLVSSGRTSCGGGEGIVGNLQNLPRAPGIRECFQARPGTYFCSTDYSGAELRAWAQTCLDLVGQSVMCQEFKEGKDPLLAFAAELMQISYSSALENKDTKEVKDNRQFSKIASYGHMGGLGPNGMVDYAKGYGIIVERDRAKRLYNAWLSHYTEARPYFGVIKALTGSGFATIKHCRTEFTRGDMSYTEAANFFFQNLCATGAKDALWQVTKEAYLGKSSDGEYDGIKRVSPLFGSRPVVFLHDEIISELPVENAHDAANRQTKVMISEMKKWLPDVPVEAEPCLMKNWYKNAKTVYSEGRLVPWTPSV